MSMLCFSGIKENLTISDNLVQILKYFFFIYMTYHLKLDRGETFLHTLSAWLFFLIKLSNSCHKPWFHLWQVATFKCKLFSSRVFVPIRATHPWKQSATNLSFYLPHTEDRTFVVGSILLKAACVCFNFCLVWVQPLKRVSASSQLCIPLSEQKTPAAAITCSFSPSVCGPVHKHTGGTKASGGILI